MPRRAIVTRTVSGTQVTVLGINTETAEPENRTYVLSSLYKVVVEKDENGSAVKVHFDEKKAIKDVQKAYDTDTFKNVKIVDHKQVDKLYGMWEEDFIARAMELDPNTREPLGQDAE